MSDSSVKLSPKALRFVIEALDFKLAADRKRLESRKLPQDERSDMENDVRFLEEIRGQLAGHAAK